MRPRESLAVLCITRDPGPRVAAMLSTLRHVVDEIVVAADGAAAERDIAAYSEAVDVVHRFPHEGTERHLAWAHQLCQTDWVLRVDGDEVPSVRLIETLPDLVRFADAGQVLVPRRWLFGSTSDWIDEHPWWPDFQARLVRRDRRLWFRGDLHWGADPPASPQFAAPCLYHLDLLLSSFEERVGKARRNERLQPGRTVAGRGELNHAYYLPERRPSLALGTVPAEDASLIERVLGAVDAPLGGDTASIPTASREEVDQCWAGRRLPASAYQATLRLFASPPPVTVGERASVTLEVSNDGGETWPGGWDRAPRIRLAYRWHADDGSIVVAEGERSPLPQPLAPGELGIVPAKVVGPERAGPHVLELDLVHEGVRWFGCELRMGIEVLPGERGWSFAASELSGAVARRPRPRAVGRLRRRHPVYLGWLGYENLGDEAMFEAARSVIPDLIGVPHRELGDGAWLRGVRHVVLGGGTLVGHAEFRTALERAADASAHLYVTPVGVEDPAYRGEDEAALRDELRLWAPLLRRLSPLGVRGPRSQRLLAELGVSADVVGDPALLLGDGDGGRGEPGVFGLNAGIAWRMWGRDPDGLVDQLVAVAQEMRERGWRVRLISIWARDAPFVDEIARRVGTPTEVVHARSVAEALEAIGSCWLFTGLKLHSVVLACAMGVPALSLAYQPKCIDFMASLGLESWAIRTDEMTVAGLVEQLQALDDQRREHADELAHVVATRRAQLRAHLDAIAAATRQ